MKHISPKLEWDVDEEGDEWFDAFGVDDPKIGEYSFRIFSGGIETIVTQFEDCTVASHWVVGRAAGASPPMLSIGSYDALTTQQCVELHRVTVADVNRRYS
jgi:hypothetical protein